MDYAADRTYLDGERLYDAQTPRGFRLTIDLLLLGANALTWAKVASMVPALLFALGA